jgi:outer membrane protein assembly factor BamB
VAKKKKQSQPGRLGYIRRNALTRGRVSHIRNPFEETVMKKLAFLAAAIMACAALQAGDWAQWRGPNRDGVAAQSPALIDELNKDTLKKAWQSDPLGGGDAGGWSQPVVAGERVYVVENHRHDPAILTRKLTRDALTNLGWMPQMPDELVKAVEAARVSEERAGKKDMGKEVNPWADEWIKTNLPKEQRKFQQAVKVRLTLGDKAMPLETLAKLDAIVDKEFAGHAEFEAWIKAQGIDDAVFKEVMKRVPTTVHASEDYLWALDRATGKTLYKTEFPGHWMYYPASSTPCVADGRVYFLSSAAIAFCADAATGNKLWESKPLGNAGHSHNRSSSVLLLDGKVIVGSDSAVYGLDAKTGETLWTNNKFQGKESSGVVCRLGDKTAVLYAASGKMHALDPETGKPLWSVPAGNSASTPVVVGDAMVFAGGADDAGLIAYKMTATEATKLWNVPFKDNYPSPIVDKGFVYVAGKGKALCVELATGTVKWEQEVKQADLSSGILADGKVLMPAPPDLAIFRATPDKFELLGRARVDMTGWSTPAFADGFLFVRTNRNIVCYDLRKQ